MKTQTPDGIVACSRCGKPASVRVEYARQDWCGECLTFSVDKRVSRAVREFDMLQRGDKVAVGISGGKDSAAMLFALNKIATMMTGITIVPILIDEGIAGYRDKAIPKAEALCQMLGLELHVFRYKDEFGRSMDDVIEVRDAKRASNPDFPGRASCSYCGVFRKTLLNKAAVKLGCNKIAIGHNTDDTAQTFLMNLLRNEPGRIEQNHVSPKDKEKPKRTDDDLSSLKTDVDPDNHGHNTVFEDGEQGNGYVPRIKPLLYVLEREAALYCAILGLPFHLAECPYANEAYRGDVKDFLNVMEQKYPGTKFNTLNAFIAVKQRLKENPLENETLTHAQTHSSTGLTGQKSHTSHAAVRCVTCGEPATGKFCKTCQFKAELD